MKQLADESPAYEDAKMLVASADTVASLKNNTVRRSIDTEWIEKIEYAIPYLDAFIRSPGIAIEEIEEILPVELTKKVSEKSIRYLSQHSNHILKIEDDDVTPSKLLNIFRDETLLTYENKFINTLLIRLVAFIDKRFAILAGTSGIEKNYVFDYVTSFHHALLESEKNSAKISLKIELTSPLKDNLTEEEIASNEEYAKILQRLYRIRSSIMAFTASPLIQALGKNYIRPPVIRTNPILKNKNLNACLTLWEYIESVDKSGFSVITDEFREMPSDDYISELYSSVALQYVQFYSGVAGDDADNRLLSERRLSETFPDFDSELDLEEVDDFTVYDTDYKKLVPISTFFKRRKLSEDERKMRVAIEVALRADRVLFDNYIAEQEELRRLEELRRAEEARRAEAALRGELDEDEDKKNIQYRYIRTFLARLIQSSDELKGYYGIVKNKFLSYKKVRSSISKRCETFLFRKNKLAKVDVRGKKLDLYLALDPAEFDDKQKFYHFQNVSDKKPDTPMLIRITGPLKLKRALELVDILLEKVGAMPIENYAEQDFYLPYETTEALVKKGLIKDLLAGMPAETPAVAPQADEEKTSPAETDTKIKKKYRYSRTCLARLDKSAEEKDASDANATANINANTDADTAGQQSYKKVKISISDSSAQTKRKLVRFDIHGRKLDLHLAVTPADSASKQPRYKLQNTSVKQSAIPMLLRITGALTMPHTAEQPVPAPIESFDAQALLTEETAQPLAMEATETSVAEILAADTIQDELTAPMSESMDESMDESMSESMDEVAASVTTEALDAEDSSTAENPVEATETMDATTEAVESAEIVEPVETVEENLAPETEGLALPEEAEEIQVDEDTAMEAILPQGYENVANVFEAKCVFKPYYEGYQQDDIIEIPMTKDEFYQLNEKKQLKIFKRAERKHNHK